MYFKSTYNAQFDTAWKDNSGLESPQFLAIL